MFVAFAVVFLMTFPTGSDASTVGDLNGDDIVDESDAIYLLYSTFYPEDYPLDQQADFNGDGVVDSEDSLYLSYHLSDPQSFPLTQTYSISYEMFGASLPESAPIEFAPGDQLNLPQPTMEGYRFVGWSLTPEGDLFNGDTTCLSEDITLYACWEETLVGHYQTMSVTGRYSAGSDSFSISGEMTRTFLRHSLDTGSYLIRNEESAIFTYASGSSELQNWNDVYWETDDPSLKYLGKESIDTIDGKVECDRYRTIHDDGTIETHWVSGWIIYKMTFSQKTGLIFTTNFQVEYLCTSHGITDVDLGAFVTVVECYGIDAVFGQEDYILGDTVRLYAETDEGVEFDGWYDTDGNVLTTSRDYEFVLTGDTKLYAMNCSSSDMSVRLGEIISLDLEGELDDVRYIISDMDTGESFESPSQYVSFTKIGRYLISVTSTSGDQRMYVVDATDYVDRTFEWMYDGDRYSITLAIDYGDFLYARDYYSQEERWQESTHERDRTFVTLSYTDEVMAPYMDELTDKLLSELEKRHPDYTCSEMLLYLLRFAQYIDYQMDQDSMGIEEYWKFPLETLYDCNGDCEDTAILFCALAHQCREKLGMDYEVAMVILPSHMAAAVKLDGKKWLYCETTGNDFNIGDTPLSLLYYMSKSRYHEYIEIP